MEKIKKIKIRAKDLCKSYGAGDNRVQALDHVSLEVFEGEMVAVLGNSGCGKSTFLNMLGGMDRFDSGSIKVSELELFGLDDKGLTDFRRKRIGFVFQSFNLIAELTARENVALTANPKDKGITDRMLELVGLRDRADCYPGQLSGGQQQRISIARAMAKEPELFLCDEPT
ncbi:MAG: ABC transporter ATP-binding protein, partial [Parasporobacterium sp.]|nr:ABC transporter ATP-binding protein [Parasporobacterium sp.]